MTSAPEHETEPAADESREVRASIGILGSCVSRDTLETMPRDAYPITTYVSRQSLLTAGSDASPNLPAKFTTSSKFQLRNVQRDIEGKQLQTLVEAGAPDVLLWDLIDERHGVFEFADGTIMTRSIDVLGIPELAEAAKQARLIEFGSDEHFLRWSGAAGVFADALGALGLRDRVLVVAIDWATADAEGTTTPWSMGKSAQQANGLFPRYYERLVQLGFSVLRITDAVADQEHRWGFAPFHYAPDVYAQVRAVIDATIEERRRMDQERE